MTVRGLEASSDLAAETGHPGKDIRPCIATLMETPLSKGEFPNRNEAALVIASELKRIGVDYDSATGRVESWNRFNNPSLRPSEQTKAVNNAFAKEYNYGCHNAILVAFCVGQDLCPFHNHVLSRKPKYNDLVFVDYGWPTHLTGRQTLIYGVALPHLEKTRRIGRGGLICANHRQIANACGISRERVGKDLKILSELGLIEYNAGIPRKWEGRASEIRRVFPIPRPNHRALRLLGRCDKPPPHKIEECHNIIRVSNTILDRSGTK